MSASVFVSKKGTSTTCLLDGLGSMHDDVSPSFSRNGNYQATAARGALLNVFTRERILQACLLSHG